MATFAKSWRDSSVSDTDGQWDYLKGNACHEAGHAIVGWALGLHVDSIRIRDDRSGENAMISSADGLPLVDQVALNNAGRQAEEVFGRLLPPWASDCDRMRTINLLLANEIREIPEMEKWIDDGQLLIGHIREVHALAARLMECRRMACHDFKRFMENAAR
jgi:hypothetical protein